MVGRVTQLCTRQRGGETGEEGDCRAVGARREAKVKTTGSLVVGGRASK